MKTSVLFWPRPDRLIIIQMFSNLMTRVIDIKTLSRLLLSPNTKVQSIATHLYVKSSLDSSRKNGITEIKKKGRCQATAAAVEMTRMYWRKKAEMNAEMNLTRIRCQAQLDEGAGEEGRGECRG